MMVPTPQIHSNPAMCRVRGARHAVPLSVFVCAFLPVHAASMIRYLPLLFLLLHVYVFLLLKALLMTLERNSFTGIASFGGKSGVSQVDIGLFKLRKSNTLTKTTLWFAFNSKRLLRS
jgi:preprotein translocase subunit SecG